jgi:serine/threonine protein kinase
LNEDLKESKREQSYYRLLEKRNISWEMLPRYYGVIESNLGHGAVFDLIRDYDGEISKTLEYYLSSSEILELQCPCFLQAFYSLKKYLYKYKIIPMDLKPENILYKKTSDKDGDLVIIDNIGNSDFIPVCNYVGYLATKKILRKWHRFEHNLLHIYAYNKALQRMLTSSHR